MGDDLEQNADYKLLVTLLETYYRHGPLKNWDDYRTKIPTPLLEVWGKILIECRRNGFLLLTVENGTLVFGQITSNKTQDLCILCERPCVRRKLIETGVYRKRKQQNPHFQEPAPCWEQKSYRPGMTFNQILGGS